MFLKKFIFVNWGNIPNLEFDFGPINLFSGGNGSGKTTAADALQTIMTAAHENLFQYNPGQDETTQRGRGGKRVRTLASYVLGCDDGSYARLDATDGYLCAVFHPTQGETAEPFTAIIAVRAWLDNSGGQRVARQEDAFFYILPGEQLSLSHLVREEKNGRHVMLLDKLHTQLIKGFGINAVEKYDTKRAYLKRLYGALRGLRDSVTEQEAMAAARAFSRFMAYKPVSSINKFVADEILERKDLGEAIRSVSSQLKTIHAMERDASQLKDSIEILGQAHQQSQAYIEQWIDLKTLDYTQAQYEYLQRQRLYLDEKKRLNEIKETLVEKQNGIDVARQRSEQIRDQLVTLEAQRMGVQALQQKDELQTKKQNIEEQLTENATQLLLADNMLQQNLQTTSQICQALKQAQQAEGLLAVFNMENLSLANQVIEQGQRLDVNLSGLMQQDFTGDLTELEQNLPNARGIQQVHNQWRSHWHEYDETVDQASLRDQLAKLTHQKERAYQELDDAFRHKQREIERLEAHRVSYPAYVERALAEIRRRCPQADPRVLCDHVEVKDPAWQSAIEGYLGGARFSIIVEAVFEAEAIRIVRGMPGRDNRARIIQGEKAHADAERMTLEKQSIIHVLDFTHSVARNYLVASYGSVLRVNSADELRHTRRGLTSDGMASGNYSMWRCDMSDADLVFGLAARERALKAKQKELQTLQVKRHEANEWMQYCATLLKAVDNLKPLDYVEVIARILDKHRALQKLDNLLAQLDLSEFEELERRLEQLKAEESEWREQIAELNKAIGELNNEFKGVQKQCQKLSDEQEQNRVAVDQWEDTLHEIAVVWPDFDADARLAYADNEAQKFNLETAQNFRQELEKQLRTSERRMSEALQKHNQQCRPGDAIAYYGFDGNYDAALFEKVCALQNDIDRVFNILKNNILLEKHRQLVLLKESFNNAFVTHLCHAIHQAISTGKKQIDQLNKELQHHRFGADQETFRFDSDWLPEYRDYARFFEEVVKSPTLGEEVNLFDADLSDKSGKVRDQLMTMLLNENEQQAMAELERIADYRNYRRYEIYKEVEGKAPIALSEYGTGSGGQLETPAYIIRSAAITSAFRFGEGVNHLRMVLVDEAFSKMDETRSREVIRYLTESLGLQLVFIMPTSKCGPFMDLISNEFVFAKCPSEKKRGELLTRVFVDRKQYNQEKIRDLWANHRRMVYQQAELDFLELL